MKIIRILLVGILVTPFMGCDNDLTFQEQLDLDKGLIADYVATNNLEGQSTDSGLFYGVTKEGNSTFPDLSNTVEVVYTGKLLDGTVFDSSDGFPVSFQLFQVIQGWQEGMTYFSEGSKGHILIPSNIAYGRNGSGAIPGNSVLHFEIELLSVR